MTVKDSSMRFVVIGMKKAGTTFLHEQLRRLKFVQVPPLKESHYLLPQRNARKQVLYKNYLESDQSLICNEMDRRFIERYFLDRGSASIKGYLDLLDAGCRASGECDPELILLDPPKIRDLKDAGVKVVCLLRNPVDRFFSHIKMIVADKTVNPNEVIRENFQQFQHQINHSLYRHTINNWVSIYGRENIFFVDQSALRDSRVRVINEIVEFITENSFHLGPDEILEDDVNVGSNWILESHLRNELERVFHEDLLLYESIAANPKHSGFIHHRSQGPVLVSGESRL